MFEKDNTKLDFPPIHERPPFWVEYLLGLAGAYCVGIASILTCEHWGAVVGFASRIASAIRATL